MCARFCGLGNITATNKMNKLLFLIDRLVWHVLAGSSVKRALLIEFNYEKVNLTRKNY